MLGGAPLLSEGTHLRSSIPHQETCLFSTWDASDVKGCATIFTRLRSYMPPPKYLVFYIVTGEASYGRGCATIISGSSLEELCSFPHPKTVFLSVRG